MIQPGLLLIRIEPAEDIRCGRFLEFDRSDEAQDVIPELDDALLIAVPRWLNFPLGAIQVLAAPEDGCWGATERLWNAFHNRSIAPQHPNTALLGVVR